MNRRWAILLAAGLGLGLAVTARAQMVTLDWVDTPPSGDALTQRLANEATQLSAGDEKWTGVGGAPTVHLRTISFDYFYPVTPREYQSLGANGVLQLSMVARNPKELPIKRAVLRFGAKEVQLQPVAERESAMPAGTPLAKTVGVNREDVFYLLPGKLPGKTAELWLVFSVPGQRFDAGKLSLALPPVLNPGAEPGQADPAALRKVLPREYPTLVKP